ncbi:phage replisome organizer N-terminal domain-containing protein [Clostridium sp. C2-6-12]
MFNYKKIKLIDAMPERDTIHYIWIKNAFTWWGA